MTTTTVPTSAAVFRKRTSQAFRDHKRRAAKVGWTLPYTLAELRAWLDVLHEMALPCAYCGTLLTEATFHLDHIVPLARRVDAATWALSNLCVTCRTCNELKSRLTAAEFRALMAVVNSMPPQAQADIRGRLRAGAARCAGRR